MLKLLRKKFKAIGLSGFSLLELTITLGILGVVSLITTKMTKDQMTGQKTIEIKSEMQNMQYRLRSLLRTQAGCEQTLSNSGITTTTSFYSSLDNAVEQCQKNGQTLSGGFVKGNFSIPLNKSYPLGTGKASIKVGDAKIIFDSKLVSPNSPSVNAIICYQIITEGVADGTANGPKFDIKDPQTAEELKKVGQIYRWYQEDVIVKNIFDPDNPQYNQELITHCNSDISDFSSANCSSLGGIFDDSSQNCKSLNIEVASNDTTPIIAQDSALTAQGNISASGTGVFCGDLTIGMKTTDLANYSDFNLTTYCDNTIDNLSNNEYGRLYVGKSATINEELTANLGLFLSGINVGINGSGKAVINNSLDVVGSLTAVPGLVETKDLTVNGKLNVSDNVKFNKKLIITEGLEVGDIQIQGGSISSSSAISFNSGEGLVSDYIFDGRIKAVGSHENLDTGVTDYLATMTYVNRLMLSEMSDSDRKLLLEKLLEYADETGIDVLRDDFLKRLNLVSGTQNLRAGKCNNGYMADEVSINYDSAANKVNLALNCSLAAPRVGTPINCEKRIRIMGGRDGEYSNAIGGYPINGTIVPCQNRDHVVVSGSCANVDTAKRDVTIRHSGSVRLNDSVNDYGVVCAATTFCEPATATHYTSCSGDDCNAFLCMVEGTERVENIRVELTCCELFSSP